MPERRIYLCGTEGVLRGDVMTGEITLKQNGDRPAEFLKKYTTITIQFDPQYRGIAIPRLSLFLKKSKRQKSLPKPKKIT